MELSPQQRTDFSMILKKTSLENIIDTIKFIEDRYKVIELLKSIVYDLTKFANERDHVQIFGFLVNSTIWQALIRECKRHWSSIGIFCMEKRMLQQN